jgi:5,10-methylene-tetrahydrofolate dehydrogenase/methenyl tetrahydrofolate cyclohydrolase
MRTSWCRKKYFIELTASKQELIQTARKRKGIEISDIFLLNPITKKLNEHQIKERIQRYKPYQESEKTFTRHINVARKDVATIEGIKRIANWIKKS